MTNAHIPVLYEESLQGLAIVPDGVYIDGTFGRGGHSEGILKRLGVNGRVIAFDKDVEAVHFAKEAFSADSRFSIVQSSFSCLEQEMHARDLVGKVNGILLDLGVSSPQLDDPKRGFSFMQEGPLDMRMNVGQRMDAATWINNAKESEIAEVLRDYGEERFYKRIARAIVEARAERPFQTTTALAALIKKAHPRWERRIHPATRSFQGIRIFINRELDDLQEGLDQALHVLAPKGRLCVISFHSLEDRLVKQFIQRHSTSTAFPPDLPILPQDLNLPLKKINGLIRPGEQEISENSRARSARLRIAEKTP